MDIFIDLTEAVNSRLDTDISPAWEFSKLKDKNMCFLVDNISYLIIHVAFIAWIVQFCFKRLENQTRRLGNGYKCFAVMALAYLAAKVIWPLLLLISYFFFCRLYPWILTAIVIYMYSKFLLPSLTSEHQDVNSDSYPNILQPVPKGLPTSFNREPYLTMNTVVIPSAVQTLSESSDLHHTTTTQSMSFISGASASTQSHSPPVEVTQIKETATETSKGKYPTTSTERTRGVCKGLLGRRKNSDMSKTGESDLQKKDRSIAVSLPVVKDLSDEQKIVGEGPSSNTAWNALGSMLGVSSEGPVPSSSEVVEVQTETEVFKDQARHPAESSLNGQNKTPVVRKARKFPSTVNFARKEPLRTRSGVPYGHF